ncbi:MAG: lipoprotein B [Candidatus Kapaibacterium sp.]|nr:MAG: lipoprotein B [Candidatus Kapabacteria bacterium]
MIQKINIFLRRTAEWMESFAQTKYSLWALFGFAFAEASFFPIPPDVLLIAMALSFPKRSYVSALWCTIGSALGGVLGYFIGYSLMEVVGVKIIDFYNFHEAWAKVVATFNSDVGYWFLAGAAFTPIPYKVATIAAGATQQSFVPFLIISFFGRGLRFFLVATLFYFFGPPVKSFIDKYFEKLTLAFLLLLVGGFVVIKYII